MLRVGGAGIIALAKQFSLSKDSIRRHFARKHVSDRRRAELLAGPRKVGELAVAAAEESKSLLDYLGITRSVLFSQFLACAEAGDHGGVALLAGKLLEALREVGKLTGELRDLSGLKISSSVNILTLAATPEFAALTKGMLALCRKHPAVRGDVVALLRGLDGGGDRRVEELGGRGAEMIPAMIECEAIEGETAHAS